MSERSWNIIRARARAVILAKLATSKELGRYLLPDQPEHQAQVRANEWLNGRRTPSTFDVMARFVDWTDKQWAKAKGKNIAALRKALKTATEQMNKSMAL